jgi:hypothetical protein
MMVELQYVDSTSVDQVAYDAESSELHIVYKKSGYYVYSGVPPEKFEQLMNTDSKGSFINREVKNVYEFRKE